MHRTPITTDEAIDAVLNGEKLEGREIPDLRALIEGIQKRAFDPDKVWLECIRCRILECLCKGLEITSAVNFRSVTFAEGADFVLAKFNKRAHFDHITFMGNTCFNDATFTQNAHFARVRFKEGTYFQRATFTQFAEFGKATFTNNAHFDRATFTGPGDFTEATFKEDANFDGARFREIVYFRAATFTKDAVLFGNVAGADFTSANFNKCSLEGRYSVANLQRANLEHARGLILDSTPIRNARFSPRASDPWSRLRRAYTGPRLVFTLMFLVAFFMPYVLKTAGWVSVSRVQGELKQHIEEARDRVEALKSEEHPAARPLTVALEAAADRLPHDNDDRWQTKSVWGLVIGTDKKWTYWVTAIVLIAYNLCRAVLTWFVATMRDAEERSGVSPAYRRNTSNAPERGDGWKFATWPARWILWRIGTSTDSYHWLILPHRFVQFVFLLAVISFCLHAVNWLQLPVILPA